MSQLSELDLKALQAIYSLRCLSEELLHRYIYKYMDELETLSRIRILVDMGLIDIVEWGNDDCIFCLTVLGVNIVRELSPVPLYTIHPRTGKRIYEVQAKELRPAKFIINHQLHLNELSLMIQEKCNIPLSAYKDSKFASSFTYAQPDGVFELEEYDIFLEMDMRHEQIPELTDKWNHYRNYFASQDYYLRRNKQIIVLFATENVVKNFDRRRRTVIESLSKTIFDLLGSNFNCYIGSSEYCADVFSVIYNKTVNPVHDLFVRHGYVCQSYNPTKATQYLQNTAGKGMFVCSYEQRPVNALKQTLYYERNQALLGADRQNAPLIMVCNNEKEILNDLTGCGVLHTPRAYYTTRERLATLPIEQALFQFDLAGNRYHFADSNLQKTIFEGKC